MMGGDGQFYADQTNTHYAYETTTSRSLCKRLG